MKTHHVIALASTVCGAVLMGVALAASEAPPPAPPPALSASSAMGAGGAPPGPPPEAVAACKGKTEGASVSFTGRGGESLAGTCQSVNGVLAARPAGMGGAGQRPPPPPR